MKRITMAGASSPIRLDRHIGQATNNRTEEIKREKHDVAGDNEAVPEQLAAPAK